MNIIMTLAMASDNDYRCFVVLTSDNIWLYEQTVDRLKRSLPGIPIIGKDEWDGKKDLIGHHMQLNGVILVATKNGTVLTRLEGLLRETVKARPYPALIIDDEADQASLNANARNPDENPTVINNLISAIRSCFDIVGYLQVTATPQALFLQSIGHAYRPEFTVLTDPGAGYIGGHTFFEKLDSPYLRYVKLDEIEDLADVEATGMKIPEGLRRSICTFYMAAVMKMQREPSETFSYLCHVSLKTAAHNRLYEIIQEFQKNLTLALKGMKPESIREEAISWLKEAYDDLTQTAMDVPPFETLLKQLAFRINSTDVQQINANAAQGQPSYASKFNILIGGTKVGRGVTIHRLLVTYYGRQSKHPQMDTVLQHARMYGYRKKDLDVTRIFLPETMACRFQLIYQSEEALRSIIEKSHTDEGFVGIMVGDNLKATRNNVIDPNEVGFFAAGRSYFPAYPEYRAELVRPLTKKIDAKLASYDPKTVYEVTVDDLLELLALCPTEPGKENGLWENSRVMTALKNLTHRFKDEKAYVCKLVDRNLSRPDVGGLGAVAGPGEVKAYSKDRPTLLMYRQNGRKDDNWEGEAFWIPVVCYPEGTYALVFNIG